VRVVRANDYGGRFRRLKVFADGALVCELKPNQEAEVRLAAGVHVLHAEMDWARSPGLSITVGAVDPEGRAPTVEVSLPFKAILASVTRPRTAVRIRLMGR